MGLQEVLRTRADSLTGILNGVDTTSGTRGMTGICPGTMTRAT